MSEEEKEQAALLDRVGKTLFPEAHLAPWASILKKREVMLNMGLRTIADIGEELDRRSWLDKNPGKPLPTNLRSKPTSEDSAPPGAAKPEGPEGPGEDEGETEAEKNEFSVEFDPSGVRGAAGMFAYCARSLAINSHDLAPSVDGIGRRQAGNIAQAMKSGVAVEPPKRTAFEKLTLRGKNKEKV